MTTEATPGALGSNDGLGLAVNRALFSDECQRLAEWALIGPVQRAALESFAERVLAAERDCRTCRNFRGTQHCHSVLRCVDGSSYKRGGVVQLWETEPVDPAPF